MAARSSERRPGAGDLSEREVTEDGLGGLGVGNRGEPLGRVLLDVIVEDSAVNHELNSIITPQQENQQGSTPHIAKQYNDACVLYNEGCGIMG